MRQEREAEESFFSPITSVTPTQLPCCTHWPILGDGSSSQLGEQLET
jgi:hypothetical protein